MAIPLTYLKEIERCIARVDRTDEERAITGPLWAYEGRGLRGKGDQLVLSGNYFVLRTDAHLRDLSKRYGPDDHSQPLCHVDTAQRSARCF